jgi:carboxyl-terminal processing protease
MELDLHTRTMLVARVWMAVEFYFAHWQEVEAAFDLEKEVAALMTTALETPDRLKFGLAMMRFFASLHNSHTLYNDDWINETILWKRNYELAPNDADTWYVRETMTDRLNIGDVITHIDGKACAEWYQEVRPYIMASSERIARNSFSSYLRLLTPDTITLTLADGRQIELNQTDAKPRPPQQSNTEGDWLVENDIGYLKIPSFNDPRFQQRALELVEQFKTAKCIIVDVRDCPGGSTPSKLIAALMDRPYRTWMEATAMHLGVFRYRYQERVMGYPHATTRGDPREGYYDAMETHFKHPMFMWDTPYTLPEPGAYAGKVIILTNDKVASAAEDFIVPFKYSGRATLIGDTTFGSTGQPYYYRLDNGIWLAIGAKRAYFPDGSRYEGAGITPDILLTPTVEDVRAGRDVILERALEMAKS